MKDDGRRILMFGGTTEGRRMAQALSGRGYHVTVCVATETGAGFLKGIPSVNVVTGRMDAARMAEWMQKGYTCCIDATHPYAVDATRSIRDAAARTGLPCYRLLRGRMSREQLRQRVFELLRIYRKNDPAGADGIPSESMPEPEGVKAGAEDMKPEPEGVRSESAGVEMIVCDSAGEACRLLKPEAGSGKRILLTTGAKEAACFSPLLKEGRDGIFVRVLPAEQSIRQCLNAGFPEDHILTGLGPYTVNDNVLALREHRIQCMVTKDGGAEGGFPEKIAAAAVCGAKVIVIRRPPEEGMSEVELLEHLNGRTAPVEI